MNISDFKIDTQNNRLTVKVNQDFVPLPPLWLRERCLREDVVDQKTRQRLFNPHELSPHLEINKLQQNHSHSVTIEFSDGFIEEYDLNYLSNELIPQRKIPDPILWKSNIEKPYFVWSELADESTKLQSLESFFQYGFIIIQQTPVERNSILTLAESYGYVRKTNFGEFFEVYSRPDANDLAYTSHALAPHTDNPYREPVPGIQLLHALVNEAPGGLSTLVDGLAVCEKLKEENLESFELLTQIPVRFQYTDHDFEIVDTHPLICKNENNNITNIHYSPRLDFMPLLDEDKTQKYQKARHRFGELFSSPEFEIRFPLQSGDLLMFDNNRILHGRTSFKPSEGARHLQGCYIDRDGPRSLYRQLKRRLEQK